MKPIKLLKPQPSPKNIRDPLANITNCFSTRSRSDKQTFRSPSYSPKNSSRSTLDNKKINLNKTAIQIKTPSILQQHFRCINHRDRVGLYRLDIQNKNSLFCQGCMLEYKNKARNDRGGMMVSEAKSYVKACEDILQQIKRNISVLRTQRIMIQKRYKKNKQQIQEERQETIRKINEQYDRQILKNQQQKNRQFIKLEQQQSIARYYENEFKSESGDVMQNIKQINIHIDEKQFRQIMDIYWSKIHKYQQITRNNKNRYTQNSNVDVKDVQAPKTQRSKSHQNQSGRQFTFSKGNLWKLQDTARQAQSFEQSLKNSLQSSIVQHRMIR